MRLSLVLVFALALGATGCVSSRAKPPPEPLTGLHEGEAVTLVLHRYEEGEGQAVSGVSPAEARAIEARLGGCLERALRERNAAARFVSAEEFRRVVFPGLAYEQAPHRAETLIPLLEHPEFQRRAATLHLRQVVVVDGGTAQPSEGGILCAGGYGGGACFGLVIWHRDSQLRAVVLDLAAARTLEGPQAISSSHAWFAMLAIVPLGMPAGFTKQRACDEFGDAVAASLTSGRPPEE